MAWRWRDIYIYLDHAEYGFTSIRIQTRLPYRIQVAMNGREWLSRQLEGKGIGFERWKNKIYRVEDVRIAQELLNEQLSTDWCSLLNSFLPIAFPTMHSTLGPDLSYTWSLWQSEWASDVLFRNQADLEKAMTALVRHAFIGGHPERLVRNFGHPTKKNGEPRRDFGGSLNTRITWLDDGYRIRHWLGSNSIKVYNQLNVLRLESTPSTTRADSESTDASSAPPRTPKRNSSPSGKEWPTPPSEPRSARESTTAWPITLPRAGPHCRFTPSLLLSPDESSPKAEARVLLNQPARTCQCSQPSPTHDTRSADSPTKTSGPC